MSTLSSQIPKSIHSSPKFPICGRTLTHQFSTTCLVPVVQFDQRKTYSKTEHPVDIINSEAIIHRCLPGVDGVRFTNCNPKFKRPSKMDILNWKLCGGDESPPLFPSKDQAAVLLPSVHTINNKEVYRNDTRAFYSRMKTPISSKSIDDEVHIDSDHNKRHLTATWTSHASFLIQADGVTILTDPVWGDRCSPVSFAGPKRMVPPPIALDMLPVIDVITISHNHYDHLCTTTIEYLIMHNHVCRSGNGENKKGFGDNCEKKVQQELHSSHPIFVVPMGMKERWFKALSGDVSKKLNLDLVVELMWWDTALLTTAVAENRRRLNIDQIAMTTPKTLPLVRITATPVQHWSKRSIFDDDMELWCGFAIEVGGSSKSEICTEINSDPFESSHPWRIYHSGDTGFYQPYFEETGMMFNNPTPTLSDMENRSDSSNASFSFDFAMLPIGAYSPRIWMSPQHVNPEDAVEIQHLIKARYCAGMHWGTFILTDEPHDEAPKKLAEAMNKKYGKGAACITPQEYARRRDYGLKGNDGRISSFNNDENMDSHPSSYSYETDVASDSIGKSSPFVFRALMHGETWAIHKEAPVKAALQSIQSSKKIEPQVNAE